MPCPGRSAENTGKKDRIASLKKPRREVGIAGRGRRAREECIWLGVYRVRRTRGQPSDSVQGALDRGSGLWREVKFKIQGLKIKSRAQLGRLIEKHRIVHSK